MLRAFIKELAAEVGLRETGRLIEKGREQVRKFIAGAIENPHPRTRKAIGELYMERHGRQGQVAEAQVEALTPTPLRLILPRSLEKATAEIRAIFGPIRKSGEAPDSTVGVEQWLLRHVKSEYAAEQAYASPRRARRKRKAEGEPES
ncbi:MAG TPA: hypothetical protein VE913_02880 [Longimicrobium sp.]|nr:hypothetical protein [Longimicrobium sp.]